MADRRSTNRAMFWRIIRRLLGANRGRLFVMMLALGAGAAVTAALLNLQVDAKRRLSGEFRAFGANVVLAPQSSAETRASTIPESLLDRLPAQQGGKAVPHAAFLYAMADVTAYTQKGSNRSRLGTGPAVIAGYRFVGDDLGQVIPFRISERTNSANLETSQCEIGERFANHFHLHTNGVLELKVANTQDNCVVSEVRSYGGTEDNQVLIPLQVAQHLTGLQHQVSVIQMSVPGTPQQVADYIALLLRDFPEVEVRPIRQFTEGEAKIYNRISGLLTATVGIVLLLTGLCVMAAMTNVAMERRSDVGLMKAIGGSMRRVLRLFLAEAALLGLAGGLVGSALGIFLSVGLGKAVFGMAARPRLIVYPVSVALTVIVAILSAFPLRRLASIRPASVFRGEA